MKHLCDLNFWVALVNGNHSKHEIADRWFDEMADADLLFFCRSTQQGFLRLMTNKAVFGGATITNRQAWDGYLSLRNDPRVEWLDEPRGIESQWMKYAGSGSSSPNVWMDAYLAAFAVLAEARLVTFDKGFRVYRDLDWIDLNRV